MMGLCFFSLKHLSDTKLCDLCRISNIVCLDACFTQKRMHDGGAGQATRVPVAHPDTFFLDAEVVQTMEDEVNAIRSSRDGHTTRTHRSGPTVREFEVEDDYIDGIRIPTSVINECKDSFTAADERRQKASTTFFKDTGLMGMLCRHDHVLFVVNMQSAGEKQHYALSLLRRLFLELPPTATVGVLYDIACQLHASLQKWNFLPDIKDRMKFGVSIFHAAGHEWPCQIVYHPRKCVGFGRSDGEGCERFWWKLSPLIPNLRVSGHFNRIYTLDRQIYQMQEKSIMDSGIWLKQKWKMVSTRTYELGKEWISIIKENPMTENYVLEEWRKQVESQTKPLPKQSKDLAKKAITDLIAFESTISEGQEILNELTQLLENGEGDTEEILEELGTVNARIKAAKEGLRRRKALLSIGDRKNWDRLKGNKFLQDQISLLALKKRIREKARARRFEMTALKKYEVSKAKNSKKLTENAMANTKKREPALKKLVERYNKGCKGLRDQIKSRRFPVGAHALEEIQLDQIWQLDVDDPIWQDVEVRDDEGFTIPDWLGNEATQQAIRNRVENERCDEERNRLKAEMQNLQYWLREEAAVIEAALTLEAPEYIRYQLALKQHHLLQLGGSWWNYTQDMPDVNTEGWGFSIDALKNVWAEGKFQHADLVDTNEGKSGSSEEDLDEENVSAALYELEMDQLAAEYSVTNW
jgi:DNA-binding ferritin-like protein (Dps family)